MFNSLKYAKILEDAGLPRNQAETHIQILSDVIGEDMATKDDIRRLEDKMISELQRIDSKMTFGFQSLEHRMTLKLGGLMAAFLATGLTAAKLLFL